MDFLENTKLIPLTQGQFAIVDAEDYDFLMQWKWFAVTNGKAFYAKRNGKVSVGEQCKHIAMHRVINGTPIGMETDHINGNGLDNRRCNLRAVNRQQNAWNLGKKPHGTSKFRGVRWREDKGKWMAEIRVNGKKTFLGYFTDEILASSAYECKARERGEYDLRQRESAMLIRSGYHNEA